MTLYLDLSLKNTATIRSWILKGQDSSLITYTSVLTDVHQGSYNQFLFISHVCISHANHVVAGVLLQHTYVQHKTLISSCNLPNPK